VAELRVREMVEGGIKMRGARLQRVDMCSCGENRNRTESAESAS